ncbi:hypothetical protein NLU13_1123 [Sarocladium strictum]|uniref:Uncharacterized protein n=1 Tax=Sarocladium strictum TaxID=5046 RepID=A0AA39LBX7_SARSR|nr:hypothetical protein NLU13_1123 [Sarocladium strictum]
MGSLGLCFRPLRLSSVHVRLARQCSDKIFVSACPPRTTVGGVKVTPFPHHVISRLRLYSAPAGKTATKKVSPSTPVKQRARLAAERQTGSTLPERLLIYHAGTGRITFLAMFKVTSLFIGAFFCFAVVPAYVAGGQLELEPIGFALCGIIPMVLIGYTSSPFVTHVHIHLPTAARASRQALERFVQAIPSSTPLTLTTMSFIGKPRYSKLQAGHLRPERSRLGLVNYVRDHVDQEAASRKWYNLPAVNKFYIQDEAALATAKKKSKGKKSPVEWWIWDAVRERIAKRAVAAKSHVEPKA